MDVFFSFSAWFDFLVSRLLLDAIFPPFAILFVFAIINRQQYKNRRVLYFLVIVCLMIVISCYAVFVRLKAGINTRYLYMLGFYSAVLCAPGIPQAARFLRCLVPRFPRISEKRLAWLLILFVGAACVGKALHPPTDKPHIYESIAIIGKSESARPILISDCDDKHRLASATNAELFPFSAAFARNYAMRGLMRGASRENRRVFLLVDVRADEFRRRFSDKQAIFPEQLTLLREFRTSRGKEYALYEYVKRGMLDENTDQIYR